MKENKLIRKLVLVILAVLTFCSAIFLTQEADATTASYRKMIALGLIDEVATPQQLGLDYLLREPVQLLARQDRLMEHIYYANEEAAQMPEDLRLGIPLGTNYPLATGALPNDPGTPVKYCNIPNQTEEPVIETCNDAIGLVNAQGQPISILPLFAAKMTNVEYRNGGDIPVLGDAKDADNILLADASGSFLQARRVPLVNLIVYNRGLRRTYLLPRVNANAFCRDVVNALRNQSWYRV